MENANFCWMIVVGLVNAAWVLIIAVVSAAWALINCMKSWRLQGIERANKIVACLLEDDKLIAEHPEIQMYLSRNAYQEPDYFRNPEVLNDELFFKAKALAYKQLNMFDEILSIAGMTSRRFDFLKLPSLIEAEDWHTYMKLKMRHPLCQSILKDEKEIFGESLRSFWQKNEKEITSQKADPFSW